MGVTRIVANLTAPKPAMLADFYRRAFGLDLASDMGWISFLSSGSSQKVERHTASEGGGGTDLPVISIGVDNLSASLAAVRAAGGVVVYGPVKEAWGLSRFYFRNSAGNTTKG